MTLNELTIDSFMAQSARVRLMALLGIFLFILLLAYFLLMKPRFAQLNTLKNQKIDLDKKYQADNRVVSTLKFHQDELKSLETIENSMRSQLTAAEELPHLIEIITQLAENNGLQVGYLKPMPEEKQGVVVATPIHLSLSGNYVQVMVFLNQLLSLKKIVTIKDLSIVAKTDGINLNIKLNLSVYRYSGEEIRAEKRIYFPDLSAAIQEPGKIRLSSNPFETVFLKIQPSEDPLTAYVLSALKMVGTIEKKGETWALIATQDKSVFRVATGMRMGELSGMVMEINRQEIKIMQTLQNGAKREVKMEIEGRKQ